MSRTASLALVLPLVACLLGSAQGVSAETRPEHHEGEAAPTLAIALANLAEYNARLDAILSSERPSPQDLGAVHELTYTLENALARVSIEIELLKETLESVHIASERADPETVQRSGAEYLERARPLRP